MASMLGITTVTISIQVLVLALHHHPPNKAPPRWIKNLLAAFKWSSNAYSTRTCTNEKGWAKYGTVTKEDDRKDWQKGAWAINGQTTDINQAQQVIYRNGNAGSLSRMNSLNSVKSIAAPPSGQNGLQNGMEITKETKQQDDSAGDDIKYVAKTLYKNESQDNILNEWRDIATDIDSLFFWVFLVLLLATTVIILGILPITQQDRSMDPESLGLYV